MLSGDLFKLGHPRPGKGDTVASQLFKTNKTAERRDRDKAYLSDPSLPPSLMKVSVCFSLPVLRCEIHSDLNFTSFPLPLSLIIKSLLPSRIEQN